MESSNEDRLAVARVLAGEVSAFEPIVRRWQGPLVTLAFRFCHHRGRAEELAQEAFLRAYRRLGQWRGDAAFSTWLFALATNLYRSEVGRPRPTETGLDDYPLPSVAGNVDERLAADEQDAAVRRAVTALPRRYRDAIVLYYFSEMDVPRAAARLGVPVGTLKARLHRARRLLKDKLSRTLSARTAGAT